MANKFILRMKDMTAQSDKDLCPTCTNIYERQDRSGVVRMCTAVSRDVPVLGRVVDCTDYYPKNLPSLRSMGAIAWEITTSKKSGKVGFITPEDRRKNNKDDVEVEWK